MKIFYFSRLTPSEETGQIQIIKHDEGAVQIKHIQKMLHSMIVILSQKYTNMTVCNNHF